ncbi:MAG: inositol monophosphatase family protein [Candidatus Hodarchaeales archaeon]|jgi:myo-inositol-1(or 4)-monophosphatase
MSDSISIRKVAEEAVRTAGSFLRLMSIDNLELFRKQGHLISSFDIEAERLIKGRISMSYPDHIVLTDFSESSTEKDETASSVTWYVDPLDGTKAFIRGQVAFVSLSAAAADKDGLVAAAIYNPFTDVLYSASRDERVFLNNRPLNPPDDVSLVIARILVDFSNKIPESVQFKLATADLGSLDVDIGRIFRFDGSIAQHLALIAQGTIDGAIFYGSGEKGSYWDIAGACLLLDKLGFLTTDLQGNPIQPSNKSFDQLVIGQPNLHSEMLDFIQRLSSQIN